MQQSFDKSILSLYVNVEDGIKFCKYMGSHINGQIEEKTQSINTASYDWCGTVIDSNDETEGILSFFEVSCFCFSFGFSDYFFFHNQTRKT